MDDNDAKLAAEDTDEFIRKMSYQYDPMLIAAFLVIKGFGIYKTSMEPDEYDLICKKIYNERDKIKEF